ncbi:MAG TPA: DUF6502 family protein [Gammaproteobacteria bacterium]|nr:DUF6502 family protein [Gammaproteobacteria bacterium]
MSESAGKALSSALLTLLRPLVRILLRNGIAFGTFAELAKKTYVDVAFEEFAMPGKKQTLSRVSVLTGLTRKETKRLHELGGPDELGAHQRYNRAVRVISGWVNDPRYQDSRGKPATLPVEGAAGSFAELVRRYSGDMPTQAMLEVLLSAGSVAREADHVELIRRAYVPGHDPADKIHILGTDVAELADTIDHNLTAGPAALRLQRKVSNDRVDPQAVVPFRALATERAQSLLEELDRWLTEHETHDNDTTRGRYVSLGIYYYEQNNPEENDP